MTSKTSLFNKGIYKSTVKRYTWGAILYAISLFLSTPLTLMLSKESLIFSLNNRDKLLETVPVILKNVYIYFPLLFSILVPTVVGLLCFRFLHAKKANVFTHSLPPARTTTYFSTLLAAFTLMFAPVVFNGIILIVMSITGYGMLFSVGSCFVWMITQFLSLFLLFSVSCFSAMLTGNSFAMVVLNGLLHGIVPLIVALISRVAELFLYGFNSTYTVVEKVIKWNYIFYMVEEFSFYDISELKTNWLSLLIIVLSAIIFYAFALILYKKRHLEKTEEVAAYNCLNFIFKYLITFVASLVVLYLYGYHFGNNFVLSCIILLLVNATVYFGVEMILKKTFKVWKSYKGYLVYTGILAVCLYVTIFTSFFGFETFIPDIADVDKVEVVSGYIYNRPDDIDNFIQDEYVKAFIIGFHTSKVQPDEIDLALDEIHYDTVQITYKLKNGTQVTRNYIMSDKEFFDLYEGLYKSKEYKAKHIDVLYINLEEIKATSINNSSLNIQGHDFGPEFINALKKDLLMLDYSQMYQCEMWDTRYAIDYTNAKLKATAEPAGFNDIYLTLEGSINANYTNTLEFLKENELMHMVKTYAPTLAIISADDWNEYNEKYYRKDEDNIGNYPDAVLITNNEDKNTVEQFMMENGERYNIDDHFDYYILEVRADGKDLECIAAFHSDLGKQLLTLIKQ